MTRVIAHEVIERLDKDVLTAIIGSGSNIHTVPSVIPIPKKEDLISLIRIGMRDEGRYSESDIAAVLDSRVLDGIDYGTDYDRSADFKIRFRDFAKMYLWGGEDFLHYARMGDVIAIESDENPRIGNLLASDWRMDRELDLNEIGFIATSGAFHIQWAKVKLSELLYVIADDRSALIDPEIPKKGYGDNLFYTPLWNALRNSVTDDSALAWYLVVINSYSDKKDYEKIARIAARHPLDSVREYIKAGILDTRHIAAGLSGTTLDPELLTALIDGETDA